VSRDRGPRAESRHESAPRDGVPRAESRHDLLHEGGGGLEITLAEGDRAADWTEIQYRNTSNACSSAMGYRATRRDGNQARGLALSRVNRPHILVPNQPATGKQGRADANAETAWKP